MKGTIENEYEKAGNEAAEVGGATELIKPAHNMEIDAIAILCESVVCDC